MKRLCSLFLLAVIIFMFSSCAGNNVEIVPEYNLEFDFQNFNGMSFSIFSDSDLFFGYVEGSPHYDSLMKRISDVEAKYNCDISYSPQNNLQNLLMGTFASGVTLCDVLYMDAAPFRNLAAGGYLLDLASYSDVIDVNDSFRWGTKNILEICCSNGHLYGVTPAAWADKLAPYYFFLVTNNDIILKNGYSHPHEYYENRTWNRGLFEEMVRNCSDLETGIYGLDTSDGFIGRMAVYSDGIGLVDESSGKPCSAWHSGLVQSNLQWAADFVNANKEFITQDGESYDDFIAGNCAIAMPSIYHFTRKIVYSSSLNEYSIMPFPCSDAVDPGTCGGFFSTGLDTISLPALSSNETETATVINAIWAPMDGYETQELLDSYYLSNVFFGSKDLEIIKKCVQNARYNYWVESVFNPIDSIVSSVISGKFSPSQAMEAYLEVADEYINDIVVPNEKGLESYFAD